MTARRRQAADRADALLAVASTRSPDARADAARPLGALDGQDWLLLDEAVRAVTWLQPVPQDTRRKPPAWWPRRRPRAQVASDGAPADLLAAVVASMDADGYRRERGVSLLAAAPARAATAALAVRLLDHVREVRRAAQDALAERRSAEDVDAVLGVLLAGRRRAHAGGALATLREAVVERPDATVVLRALLPTHDAHVARWAFEVARDVDALDDATLVGLVRSARDGVVRRGAALLLVGRDPAAVVRLADRAGATARAVALADAPDDLLPDDLVLTSLVSRSPRVRDLARRRAAGRGVDPVRWYRERLADTSVPDRLLAAASTGLAEVGDVDSLPVLRGLVHHRAPGVRAAAVDALGRMARDAEVLGLVAPSLVDRDPRVVRAAGRVLADRHAPAPVAEAAWASDEVVHRRAAWRLVRSAGGWHRLEADLRAAADADPDLHADGRAAVGSWVRTDAARTWAPTDGPRRRRIARLLSAADVDAGTARVVAFHAGLDRDDEGDEAAPTCTDVADAKGSLT